MADTSFSRASLRMQRGRNPSGPHAPSSRNFDDGSLRLPTVGGGGGGGGGGGNHSLRSVSSRFSLGEHFAATRSLYEFGFDDASSYAAPSVMAPGEAPGDCKDGAGAREQQEREVTELLDGDFYDTLCLPRAEEGLSKEDVRRAYHRMFLLFYPDMYPQGMQEIARRQFDRAQEGFEVLVDEVRRRKYDGEQEEEDEEEGEREEMQERHVWSSDKGSRSDVGVRVDASRGVNRCQPLDFVVGHSSSIPLPCLSAPGLATTNIPSLTLSSSIYGIVPPMSLLPMHTLSSPHQPLHPATSPRHRLLQLVESKISPVVGARLVHDVTNLSQGTAKTWLGTRCESSIDILPALAPSIRLFHSLDLLPDTAPPSPTIVETSIKSRSWWSSSHEASAPPRAALGVQHPLLAGTAFARVDSGDWDLTPEAYRFVTSSGVARAMEVRYADFPLRVAPTVELGFTTAPETMDSGSWRDAPVERASSLLDGTYRPKTGSWTVSSVIQPLTSFTTTLLYTSPPLPVISSTSLQLCLSASTMHPSTLSLRHLFPIGTANTTCGLELSFSRFATHVSLHISHSDRHFSLPLLFPTVEHLRPQTMFLASAVPFLALAAYRFLSGKGGARICAKRRNKSRRARTDEALKNLDTSSPVVQAAIAHRREEADHLTGLLANPVATRQKHHASHGNLVILSAKFGLPAPRDPSSMTPAIAINSSFSRSALPVPVPGMSFHPDEEIADVTVALAALVDDQTGGLWIPPKVQKGCIPGFWDPAPGREKLLLVRYSWRGREDMIAVQGDEELVLPPK